MASSRSIKALVPARELYRYSSTIRSLTAGRGVHAEAFHHYEEMPREPGAKSHRRVEKAQSRSHRGQGLTRAVGKVARASTPAS